jgi:phospholipid/cholesterol/gamma-HCH transport system substrate-binding protein
MSRLERLYSPPEIGAPGKREARARRRDLLFSGIFVLAMGLAALAAFTLVSPGLFGGTYRLIAYFGEARGLDQGIQVLQGGYEIGIVEGVEPVLPGLDPEASRCPSPMPGAPARSPLLPCFRATLRIRGGWPVPADSEARLGASGLLSGDAVMVSPGTSATRLSDGATIAAAGREPDLMDRLSALSEALNGVVKDTLAPALASIKTQIEALESMVGGGADQGENRTRLAGTLENLNRLSGELAGAIDGDKIAGILSQVDELSGRLVLLSTPLRESTEQVERAAKSYDVLAAEIRDLVTRNRPGMERTLDDSQYLLQELTSALTPILANLEDATRNLAALSRDLRRDPDAILKGRKAEPGTPWLQ